MSSQDEANDSENAKQRNIERKKRARACDACRRRKVRCDGDAMPDGFCSNCRAYNYACTYAPKKRAVDPLYIENLERQLAQAQEALRKMSARLDGDALDNTESARSSPSSSSSQPRVPPKKHYPALPPIDGDDFEASDEEEYVKSFPYFIKNVMSKNGYMGHPQFVGKSSSFVLVQQVLDMKESVTDSTSATSGSRERDYFQGVCVEAWRDTPWIAPSVPYPYSPEDFPDADLLPALASDYFKHSNTYMPILNQVIFQKGIEQNLHLRDEGFASTVLLVCAIGSRFSMDERVLLDGYADNWQTAGWKWFKRVQDIRKTFDLRPQQLSDIQVSALAAVYLYGSPTPHVASVIIAHGLRIAMDLGAHKKKVYKAIPNAEDELTKRVFWVLVVLDRTLSSILGRPCSIQEEDYDLDLPIECDDEYWFTEYPSMAFKQPADKPSLLTAFSCLIRLMSIHGATLRTVYATNKSKAHWGFGSEWQEEAVTLIDSALNKWFDSIPAHLRWDPNLKNDTFLHQSALLYSSYYHLQITLHRSFIPIPSKTKGNFLPSLTICTNAARACVHVLEVEIQRNVPGAYHNLIALFNAGIVLVLNIWANKHSNVQARPATTRELADVRKVLYMLRLIEPRFPTAGRVEACMRELAAISDVQVPGEPPRGQKRPREADAYPSPSSASSQSTPSTVDAFAAAGSYRAEQRPGLSPSGYFVGESSILNFVPSYGNGLSSTDGLFNPASWLPPSAPDSAWFSSFTPPQSSPTYNMARSNPAQPNTQSTFGPPLTGNTAMPSRNQAPYPSQPFTTPSFHPNFTQASQMPRPPDAAPAAGPSYDSQPMQQCNDPASCPAELFDSDVLAMLSSAPTSLEWNDWGSYFSNLNDINNVRGISAGVAQL